jgi:predicted O-methyltransferase YrrM
MPYQSQWAPGIDAPAHIHGFEDLAFLFNNRTKATRGIIRMNIDEAAALYKAVRSMIIPSDMIEIGRAEGGSTILMAAAARPETRFVSFDSDPVNDENLASFFEKMLPPRHVELLIADSQTADIFQYQVGLVFIDGDHTYEGVKADFQNWLPAVLKGGYLVFHDINDPTLENHGPSVLYRELLKRKDIREVQELCGGSVRTFQRI